MKQDHQMIFNSEQHSHDTYVKIRTHFPVRDKILTPLKEGTQTDQHWLKFCLPKLIDLLCIPSLKVERSDLFHNNFALHIKTLRKRLMQKEPVYLRSYRANNRH